ncbi:MAG: hypothetical protein Q4E24_13390 [bacterium]|nr:hypothetical protein [bacterium]
MEEKKMDEDTAAKRQKYSKQQLLEASKYREKRDLLQVLLIKGQRYSFEDAEKLVSEYMKGQVK